MKGPEAPKDSYGQILKASALVGGSTMVTVAAGIVRAKVFAVLLGPSGFGLMGLYLSIVNLAESVAGMGINTAGVRQLAASAATGQGERVARTAQVLRWSSLVLGLAGALLLGVLATPVSQLTFGDADRSGPVALLSLAVLFRTIAAGRGALLQGLRRIADLAMNSVWAGILGTALSIALVLLFRDRGIVPSIVGLEATGMLVAFWYSRRVALEPVGDSARGSAAHEAAELLRIGFAFMASGMLAMGSAYAVRMLVSRNIGLDAAGLYQSAWMVGGLYVGFILQSMGADFYPRLTAAIGNPAEANRLINEQARVSMLLAGPGVLGTLTFAPLIVPLFYSAAFGEGVELLRWLCIGVTLRVITWPIGYLVVAHARQAIFLAVEVAYALVFVALAWAGVRWVGLNGSGIAFFLSYVFHGLMLYPVVRWLSGFAWSAENRRLCAVFLTTIGTVFASDYVLPRWLSTTVGAGAVIAMSLYSVRTLVRLVSPDRLPTPVRRVAAWLGLLPRQA